MLTNVFMWKHEEHTTQHGIELIRKLEAAGR
jgi:hypothetical protein